MTKLTDDEIDQAGGFWMVHGVGPSTHRHATESAAIAEAERLARTSPGIRFYVLHATAYAVREGTRYVLLPRDRRYRPPTDPDEVPLRAYE